MPAKLAWRRCWEPTCDLRRVNVPMLYLQATEGRLIPRSALEAIERIHPGIEVAAFAAPHFLLQVEPEETARRVGQFVRSLDSAG